MSGLFGNDWNWIAAGVGVGARCCSASASLTHFPFLVSAIIAVLVFAGLVFLLAPRQLFEGHRRQCARQRQQGGIRPRAPGAGAARRPTGSRRRRHDLGQGACRPKVKHLADIAADVFAKVEAKPDERAGNVRRFLTYYLPRAAEVAEGYAVARGKPARTRRRAARPGRAR